MRLPSLSVNITNPKLHRLLAAASALLLASCTTVQSDVIGAGDTGPATGLVYYLPIRTLSADAKFQLLDCGLNRTTNKAELVYDLNPTVTTVIVADRRRGFTISKGLNGKVLKAMNFELAQYENGTLKSVNLVADDRTAETATNVLSGALKFGLALTGGGLFSGDRSTRPNIEWLRYADPKDKPTIDEIRRVCGVTATEALLQVHELTRQLKGTREATDAKTKAAAKVTETEKAVAEARASLKAAKEAGGEQDVAQAKEVLAEAVKKLVAARAAADKVPSATASGAITQDIAAIVQRHLTFSASGTHIPMEIGKFEQWNVIYPKERLQAAGVNTETDLKAVFQLTPFYARSGQAEAAVTFSPAKGVTDGQDGIWFRSPAQALLEVCVDVCGQATSRLSQTLSVPQWGQMARLPLRNMAFAKNTTKLSFAPDGALLSLSSDATAAAERASGAFVQSSEMLLDYSTKRRALLKELAAEETAAGKAAIQEQLDLLALEQQLAAAQSTIGPEREAQLSALNFQIQQTQKQIELLELQAKLQALQTAPQ